MRIKIKVDDPFSDINKIKSHIKKGVNNIVKEIGNVFTDDIALIEVQAGLYDTNDPDSYKSFELDIVFNDKNIDVVSVYWDSDESNVSISFGSSELDSRLKKELEQTKDTYIDFWNIFEKFFITYGLDELKDYYKDLLDKWNTEMREEIKADNDWKEL